MDIESLNLHHVAIHTRTQHILSVTMQDTKSKSLQKARFII